MTVSCAFMMWNKKEKNFKYIFRFIGISALCYIVTLGLFYFMFVQQPDPNKYVDITTSFGSIFPNIIRYLHTLWTDFGYSAIKIFSLFLFSVFLITQVQSSKQKKFFSFLFASILLILSLPLSYGIYIVLEKPSWDPRSFTGIGILLSIVSLMTISAGSGRKKRILYCSYFICFFLSYSIIAFSFAYGNAQAAQKEYTRFRTELLLQDLQKLIPSNSKKIDIEFTNSIGYAASIQTMEKIYPVITTLVDTNLNHGLEGKWVCDSYKFGKLAPDYEKEADKIDSASVPVLLETAYYKIQGKESKFLITFKTPDFKIPR